MCGRRGVFHKTTSCNSDEWCTGPTNKENATAGARQLCTKGKYHRELRVRHSNAFIE